MRVLLQLDLEQHLGGSTPVRGAAPRTGHGARISVVMLIGRQANRSHLPAERHPALQAQQSDVVLQTGWHVFGVRNDLGYRKVDSVLGAVGLVEERHPTDVVGTEFDNRWSSTVEKHVMTDNA